MTKLVKIQGEDVLAGQAMFFIEDNNFYCNSNGSKLYLGSNLNMDSFVNQVSFKDICDTIPKVEKAFKSLTK